MSRLKKDNKRVAEYSVTTNFYWHKKYIWQKQESLFCLPVHVPR